jgi:hypothetical protein
MYVNLSQTARCLSDSPPPEGREYEGMVEERREWRERRMEEEDGNKEESKESLECTCMLDSSRHLLLWNGSERQKSSGRKSRVKVGAGIHDCKMGQRNLNEYKKRKHQREKTV